MGTLKSSTLVSPILLLSALLLTTGCRICADCEDLAYPAYGGAWQRTIRQSGRVGSIYDPAGAKSFDLVARDQPEDADQLERKRYQAQGSGVSDPEQGQDPDESSGDGDTMDKDREESLNENDLRDKELDDIENPKEQEQQQRKLDEIDVRRLQGNPSPPLL